MEEAARGSVTLGDAVYGAAARPPTLEDVYFAVEARIAAADCSVRVYARRRASP